jgi:hypothetical protein
MTPLAFIQALAGAAREHIDVLLSLVAFAALLAFVEYRLRDLFARHEVREEKMHATSAMLADAAAATAREASKHLAEVRTAASDLRIDIDNLGALVKMHDGRLGAVEERLMRIVLAVPRARSTDPDAT